MELRSARDRREKRFYIVGGRPAKEVRISNTVSCIPRAVVFWSGSDHENQQPAGSCQRNPRVHMPFQRAHRSTHSPTRGPYSHVYPTCQLSCANSPSDQSPPMATGHRQSSRCPYKAHALPVHRLLPVHRYKPTPARIDHHHHQTTSPPISRRLPAPPPSPLLAR
jgi:hypothetical protein